MKNVILRVIMLHYKAGVSVIAIILKYILYLDVGRKVCSMISQNCKIAINNLQYQWQSQRSVRIGLKENLYEFASDKTIITDLNLSVTLHNASDYYLCLATLLSSPRRNQTGPSLNNVVL